MQGCELSVTVRMSAGSEGVLIDERVAVLLRGVRVGGSLAASARLAEISYAQAWKAIRRAENNAGTTLVKRGRGQKGRLTAAGEALLGAYSAAHGRVSEAFLMSLGSAGSAGSR